MTAARSMFAGGALLALATLSSFGLAGEAASPRPLRVEQGAPDPAAIKAEIIVLHATNDGKGIDPNLGKMPELGEPPFSSYNSYKLIEKVELDLAKGKAIEHKLPDKGKLALTFKEMKQGAKDAKKKEPTRYVLATSIEKPDGTSFLPGLDVNALQGKYFFIAGQKYEKGILVVGIKVK